LQSHDGKEIAAGFGAMIVFQGFATVSPSNACATFVIAPLSECLGIVYRAIAAETRRVATWPWTRRGRMRCTGDRAGETLAMAAGFLDERVRKSAKNLGLSL
jgi:hypothetical protein